MTPDKIAPGTWARLRVNCPYCGRDVRHDNDGRMDAHFDQRRGKICLGGGLTQAQAKEYVGALDRRES